MATWTNQFVRPNEYSRPGKKLKEVRKLIVHWTANLGASAANHYKYFDASIVSAKRYASAHIFVDKKEALCIVPLDEVAYAANDGTYRGVPELTSNANFYSISVELCVEKDGTFHADTLAKAVEVFAELCKTYQLDPINDIVRHYDVTHKNCPAPWVSKPSDFEAFKVRVKEAVDGPRVVLWDGAELRKGQIGRLTVIKPINLWRRDEAGKLTMERILQPGEVYRVYGYDELHGGQYNVGGLWVTKMDGYIKYETPSKELLAKVKAQS